jgi:hypothetical protein
VVNIGFWIGFLLLCLRALDDIVPPNIKDQFQAAIETFTFHLADMTLDRMYGAFRSKRMQHVIAIAIAFGFIALAIWRAIEGKERFGRSIWSLLSDSRSLIILVCGFAGYLYLRICGPRKFRKLDHPQKALKWMLYEIAQLAGVAALMAILMVGAAILTKFAWQHSITEDARVVVSGTSNIAFLALLLLCLFSMTVGLCLIVCAFITLILITVRYPMKLLAECMFRIATFPKGAWSAVVSIVTVVLGFLKLVFSQ